jgi:hypothetical protein
MLLDAARQKKCPAVLLRIYAGQSHPEASIPPSEQNGPNKEARVDTEYHFAERQHSTRTSEKGGFGTSLAAHPNPRTTHTPEAMAQGVCW